MWQPNRAQWSIIWSVAVLTILAWPPAEGRSLIITAINWAADPGNVLPTLPAPLPMSLDDNGDAVTAHDAEETAYYQLLDRSAATRWRIRLKDATDPIAPATERQLLVGLVILCALAVWRLNG